MSPAARAGGTVFIDTVMRRGAERMGRAELRPPASPGEVSSLARADAEAMLFEGLLSDTLTHQHLAARFGGAPDRKAIRRVVNLLARRPAWVSAEVLPGDALFIYDMVRHLRPSRIIEIGTGSGFSGLFLLAALADSGVCLRGADGRAALETFDLCERCAWNDQYATGAAIAEVSPRLARGARFHRGKTSTDAPGLLAGHRFALAYIDASHRHPWPLADVINIGALLEPGAWLCLNDIALAEIALHYTSEHPGADTSGWQCRGPQLLFDHWPWPKIRGVGWCANMGAIQVPDPAALTPAAFQDLIRYPWEAKPTEHLTGLFGTRPAYRRHVPGSARGTTAEPAID